MHYFLSLFSLINEGPVLLPCFRPFVFSSLSQTQKTPKATWLHLYVWTVSFEKICLCHLWQCPCVCVTPRSEAYTFCLSAAAPPVIDPIRAGPKKAAYESARFGEDPWRGLESDLRRNQIRIRALQEEISSLCMLWAWASECHRSRFRKKQNKGGQRKHRYLECWRKCMLDCLLLLDLLFQVFSFWSLLLMFNCYVFIMSTHNSNTSGRIRLLL